MMKHVRSVGFMLVAVALVFASIPAAIAVTMVNLELKNTPIKGAIDSLFVGTGLQYTVDPSIVGNVVELRLKGISFKDALNAFCDAAGLAYSEINGVYTIFPAPSRGGAGPTKTIVSSAPTQPRSAPAASAPAAKPAEVQPPQQQKAETINQTGPQSGEVSVTQIASPIYYSPPSYPAFGGGQGFGYGRPMAPVGFVGSGGGWGGPVLIGPGPPLVWQRDYLPPPPPGYVNAEVQRFLQTQYAVKGRQYIVPIY